MEKIILIQCGNTILMTYNTNPNHFIVIGVFLTKKKVAVTMFQVQVQNSTYDYSDLLFSLRVPFDGHAVLSFQFKDLYKL